MIVRILIGSVSLHSFINYSFRSLYSLVITSKSLGNRSWCFLTLRARSNSWHFPPWSSQTWSSCFFSLPRFCVPRRIIKRLHQSCYTNKINFLLNVLIKSSFLIYRILLHVLKNDLRQILTIQMSYQRQHAMHSQVYFQTSSTFKPQ